MEPLIANAKTDDLQTSRALTRIRAKINELVASANLPSGGAFTGLTDVPGSYSGAGGYVVKVNPGATGLEFQAGGGGAAFPVGSVFIAVVATNPATLLGYGTWAAFGTGRVLVGIDSGDADFDTVEETGGAKTNAISAHAGTAVTTHAANDTGQADIGATAKGSTGSTVTLKTHTHSTPALTHSVTQPDAHTAVSVVQPYIVVYMWKRTA